MDPYAGFWREDLGRRGDLTTKYALPDPSIVISAKATARHDIIASGIHHAHKIFEARNVKLRAQATDGKPAKRGQTLFTVRGPARGVLEAERLALNVVGRMSGIATLTHRLQARVTAANPKCSVAGTRKTTPGFRQFEKEAIEHGGGERHRDGLYDAILIKDNHWPLLDDLHAAIVRLRRRAKGLVIEVEVTNKKQAEQAAREAVDWILIDNQTPPTVRRLADTARAIHPDIKVEASGGINRANVARYAPHVDRISLGLITHSAPCADISLSVFTKA